jgi:hypothetical protein
MKLLKRLGFINTKNITLTSIESNNTSFVEEIYQKPKTTNEIIEEIHETFYTEVDRLLAEAKILKSTETNLQPLLDKVERLKALGFTNTKECKEAESEIKRLKSIEHENLSKERIKEAIEYFSVKYPNNKFITEQSVKKICEKYNLVYGTIDKYIGTVPDKNLVEIANFKIHDEDKACYRSRTYISDWGFRDEPEITLTSYAMMKAITPNNSYTPHYDISYGECKLEIAAPVSDFNMKDYEIKDFKLSKIHIPDPVVLQPVLFKNTKYYLILSAWGQEASDELVVNQKFN